MPVTDPVADMLTRIRNAIHAGHPRVEIPASNMKISIANVLAEEGFIRSYQVRERAGRAGRDLDVELLYDEEGTSVVTGLKRVSRPGLRVYVRVGRLPVPVPAGVNVTIEPGHVSVKGPRGELQQHVHPDLHIALGDDEVVVTRPSDRREHRSQHGLVRALIQNMVTGVSEGWSKTLEIQGTGYRAEMDGKTLVLRVGYSHLGAQGTAGRHRVRRRGPVGPCTRR